jgi:hypothetical protein
MSRLTPPLFVKVELLTVTAPVAGTPTTSPTMALPLDWTCRPAEKLFEAVTPVIVAVFNLAVSV